ncbi:cytochrome-450 hydroxylase [Mycena belliarum]|uniref:Cytochrome-450 hydroxylase n=1 Tax=Mycena belliarum TaxID=1033014 RepID=A0AAD6U350_9AGAR|nr:cytochrome-450 hydroxylase [Mycena belliae]
MSLILYLLSPSVAALLYVCYRILVVPRFSPLRNLPGPPVPKWFGNHLLHVLDPTVSSKVYEILVKRYGRSVRIRGLGPWDERLLTLDPASLSHIMKNTTIYEKPWQSRRLITSLIGCGMLSAEGQVHKRQRRVAMPAFSGQNMRSLVEISFKKGMQLRDVWMHMLPLEAEKADTSPSAQINVGLFLSRATFDVIGLAGFDYNFNSINDESNELFVAYKDMFEVAISQGSPFRTLLSIYLPTVNKLFPDETVRSVQRGKEVIHRVAGRLIQEKKRKILEGEKSGDPYEGKDLLTLLLKSNAATDLPPEHRISDDDILNNINTLMFAGSDTSSLSMTWTLLLLAQNPDIQDRLRAELLSIAPEFPRTLSDLSEDEVQSLHTALSGLPLLHNVTRESLRLIPPLHSTLRVATQDDEIPTLYPVHNKDGSMNEGKHSFPIPKGTCIHLSFEAFNLDKAVWGDDAWDFNPDRWDHLPEAVQRYPWHFSNILSFSAGQRACPGVRFAMIEIKTLYYILLTNFVFREAPVKITKHNVVLTRPYLAGKFKDGTQCPLLVSRFVPPH